MSKSLEQTGIDFTLRLGEMVRWLRNDGKGFPLAEQLLICGVNAGMCCRDGKNRDAAKQVRQAEFMIQVAVSAGYLTDQQCVHILADCANLLNTLSGNSKRKTGEAVV